MMLLSCEAKSGETGLSYPTAETVVFGEFVKVVK